VTSDYELLLVITLSETRFITRISSEPVPYFYVPHRLTQIDWVPINADQSVAEAVVVQPKLVAARFFGMPEEVVPLLAGNQEWPRTTKANQFFKLIQELMVKLVNERLHGIEGQVNGVLEFVTGRIGTGRAVRNREYQLDETRLGKEQIVNLSITYCKTIVN
jgi:hypothetical protein